MKKVFLSSSIVMMLLFSQALKAEIVLEHTFYGSIQNSYANWHGRAFTEQLFPDDCYYESYGSNKYYVKIYNADYSIRSENEYSIPSLSGYSVYQVTMSKKLFNTDDNYEFLTIFIKDGSKNGAYDRYKAILFDQDGNKIKDFGEAAEFSILPHISPDNHLRLLVLKYGYGYTTEIYSIRELTTDTEESSAIRSSAVSPYPNPSNAVITLPYQLNQGEKAVMNIYNQQGQLIESKLIDSTFDKILLNVSNYAKGIYFYEVNGVSIKFIVK